MISFNTTHTYQLYIIFLKRYSHHRDLHSFPTRRSSDLKEFPSQQDGKGISGLGRPALASRHRHACPKIKSMKALDRKSTRLNSSHTVISYAVFCLKKKKKKTKKSRPPPKVHSWRHAHSG